MCYPQILINIKGIGMTESIQNDIRYHADFDERVVIYKKDYQWVASANGGCRTHDARPHWW